jgi:solute carrier family 25 S-adenosylmethionine transporter 26
MDDRLQWYHHLAIGATSRAMAISIMYPLDTIKTMIQNNATAKTSLLTYSHKNYYQGFSYVLGTQSWYAMAVFGTYENLKKYLTSVNPKANKKKIYLQSALIADFTGSIFLCPMEVIKQNIQIGRYTTASHAFYGISRAEGVRGLYKGYYSLLLRDLPFRCIQLPLYDGLKDYYNISDKNIHECTTFNNFASCVLGAFSGMVAGTITTPTDVLKTYMMCNTYKNNLTISIKNIYNTKGVYGFFAGLPYRVVYLGGSSSIFFMCYEKLRQYI